MLEADDATASRISTAAQLMLFSGATMHDTTTDANARACAKQVFGELLALAVSHGFTGATRLCALCSLGHYACPEVSVLAYEALARVPLPKVRATLKRVGIDLLPDATDATPATDARKPTEGDTACATI